MLFINIGSVTLGALLFLVCAKVLNNLTVLLCAIVFTIMLRSVVSEMAVMKTIHVKLWKEFILELVMTVIFIGSTFLNVRWHGCLVYFVCLCGYLLIKRKELRKTLRLVR